MVTTASIEQIFRRRGWPYRLESGFIVTSVEGVPLVIGVAGNGQDVMIGAPVYVARGANLRAFQAHIGDLDTFLSHFAAQMAGSMRFEITRDHDSVLFRTIVRLSGGAQDDAQLAQGIVFTVAVAQALRPLVEGIVHGQISAWQAIDILDRAIAEAEREMRRRSA